METQQSIQAGLDAGGQVVVEGVVEIAPPGLQMRSGTSLTIKGALIPVPVDWNGKVIVTAIDVSNVRIAGNIRGHGASNVDGIYIRGTDIWVEAFIEGASRNGISITGGKNIRIKAVVKDTSGNTPGSGVDVEPNPGATVDGVSFVECDISGNNDGVTLNAGHGAVSGISISHSKVHDNRGHGLSGSGLLGSVRVDHSQFVNNSLRQVFFEPADIVLLDHVEAAWGKTAGYEAVYVKANVLSSIMACLIHDSANDGLHVTGDGKHTVMGNFFWRNAAANFNRPDGAIIEHNHEIA